MNEEDEDEFHEMEGRIYYNVRAVWMSFCVQKTSLCTAPPGGTYVSKTYLLHTNNTRRGAVWESM